MNIITLFCNIDDFFLAYEKWQATHCLPEATPQETRGRPRHLHPSEVMTILIEKWVSDVVHGKDMIASIGVPSFQIW